MPIPIPGHGHDLFTSADGRLLSASPFGAGLLIAAADAMPTTKEQAWRVCSGADDDVDIQAAIDNLPAGGGKVLLSEGTFVIAASIVPVDGLTLEGQGEATVLFAASGLDDDVIGTPASGTLNDAKFRHFKVDGNRDNTASGHGIYLYAPRWCVIEYVTVETCDDDGIHIAGAASPNQGWYNWIHHNHVALCDGRGISISGTEFNWIENNIVRFITGAGIYADVSNDQIKDNILDSITGDSIHVELGAGRWTITGNDIDRPAGDGIVMRRNDFGICSDNRINNLETDKVGIRNGDGADPSENSDHLLISRNQIGIKGGETDTIGIAESRESDSCEYINNHLVGLAIAISPDSSSTNLVVRNNTGYVTENSGIATLVNGQTAIVVTHGLAVTPIAGDIMITPVETLASAAEYRIGSYTSTQFTITVDADPTQDVDFAWKAVVL